MSRKEYCSCFEQVYDVCIVGCGLAGLAAAMRLEQSGRSVLLVGPEGDLAWEAGRALMFHPGHGQSPQWDHLISQLRDRDAADPECIDPAVLEVVATDWLRASQVTPLYYAMPLAAEMREGLIHSIIVATKAGPRRIGARRWIDATENALLSTLAGASFIPRKPQARIAHIFFQQKSRPRTEPQLESENLSLHPTLWPTERALRIRIDPEIAWWRDAFLPAIGAMHRAVRDQAENIQISHASYQPLDLYAARDSQAKMPDNLSPAAAAAANAPVETLAQRFQLGIDAAQAVESLPEADTQPSGLDAPLPEVKPVETCKVDVMIAGAGTGGALSAIAAGREFLNQPGHVLCAEALSFPGGIGTGGGINGYYYGVPGGLQEEVDDRVLELHQSLGGFFEVRPQFHPLAKLLVLEQMIRQAGTRLCYDSLLSGVGTNSQGKVISALLAGPRGPIRIEAETWIDATGDGDICKQAGASLRLGREEDGLLHTFSQSSGMITERNGRITCRTVNFDADWCDPTDPEDLTRGRVLAISQYLQDAYDNFTRPTYISPAIGLRQGPQIDTDYVITFEDTVSNPDFPDTIGLAGSWYDNHSVDFEAESDEAVFWMWVARCFRTSTGCRIPYRALLPKGLSNVFIASRCLGVSIDAHYMLRMQRDMQRIGEAAAYAASFAAQHHLPSREVPLDHLQGKLQATDSLRIPKADEPCKFNSPLDPAVLTRSDDPDQLRQALDKLRGGIGGRGIWLLYIHRRQVEQEIRELLQSPDDSTSWLSAGILAMWRDPQAQPRLIRAIEHLEYGFDERAAQWMPELRPNEEPDPLKLKKLAPNWLSAVVLLRRCGSDDCLGALESLAQRRSLSLNARTAIALTLARLCREGKITRTDQVRNILEQLEQGDIPLRMGPPQRLVGGAAQLSLEGKEDDLPHGQRNVPFHANIRHDFLWQLDLAIARTRQALGDDLSEYQRYLSDPRLFVRRAFANLQNP